MTKRERHLAFVKDLRDEIKFQRHARKEILRRGEAREARMSKYVDIYKVARGGIESVLSTYQLSAHARRDLIAILETICALAK